MSIESKAREIYAEEYKRQLGKLKAQYGKRSEFHRDIAHRGASLKVLGITSEQIQEGDRRFDSDFYPFDLEGPAHQLRRIVLSARDEGETVSIQDVADKLFPKYKGMSWREALKKVHKKNPVPKLPLP